MAIMLRGDQATAAAPLPVGRREKHIATGEVIRELAADAQLVLHLAAGRGIAVPSDSESPNSLSPGGPRGSTEPPRHGIEVSADAEEINILSPEGHRGSTDSPRLIEASADTEGSINLAPDGPRGRANPPLFQLFPRGQGDA